MARLALWIETGPTGANAEPGKTCQRERERERESNSFIMENCAFCPRSLLSLDTVQGKRGTKERDITPIKGEKGK